MTLREGPRPGGRSARVQESVHQATQALLAEAGRDTLTVPQIAARAGVTPSTIYRRWGDLPQLLADVALQHMRPDTGPIDTGTLRGDLETWVDQYTEEMSSAPGRAMLRDVLAAPDQGQSASQCAGITRAQIEQILHRAQARGEAVPEAALLMERVVAPIVYRMLFDAVALDTAYGRALLAGCLQTAAT
jgi:AcrR family transcriptional regulator